MHSGGHLLLSCLHWRDMDKCPWILRLSASLEGSLALAGPCLLFLHMLTKRSLYSLYAKGGK